MSVRLPVVPARGPIARTAVVAERQRVAVTRPLLCITDGAGNADAALHFAGALIAALARHGRTVAVLVARGSAFAAQRATAELQALPAQVLELTSAELPEAALAALDGLAPDAIAIAVGAELSAWFEALLTIRIGRDAAASGVHAVDLELPADAEAVASEIGAWLAQR